MPKRKLFKYFADKKKIVKFRKTVKFITALDPLI